MRVHFLANTVVHTQTAVVRLPVKDHVHTGFATMGAAAHSRQMADSLDLLKEDIVQSQRSHHLPLPGDAAKLCVWGSRTHIVPAAQAYILHRHTFRLHAADMLTINAYNQCLQKLLSCMLSFLKACQ